MIAVFLKLEPRQFLLGEMIYKEQEDAAEMYFVTEGKYDVGFCLND